nr:unnamed protein product [Digitaria exilis]
MAMEGSAACNGVRIVSRRMVRPWTTATAGDGETTETVHLTPWDLQMLTVDYIQMGVLLPRPPTENLEDLLKHLERSLAHALARCYPYAGRLAVHEHGGGKGITVSLLCTGDGAEFIHAVADDVTIADVMASPRIPRVVWSFFPLNGMISRGGGSHEEQGTMAVLLERWFPDTCPVPVPLPFPTLEHAVRRFHGPPVEECFLTFSAESVRDLKKRANAEMMTTTTKKISSLQSLLAHVWLAVTRARRLPPETETSYTLAVGCRGRVPVVAQAYAGNAMVRCAARATAGEILRGGGLGRAAWLLNRAVASRDEAALVGSVASWHEGPRFAYLDGWWHPALLVTGNSPRFDAFGNDFGWGRPLAVRSGAGNKVDGRA